MTLVNCSGMVNCMMSHIGVKLAEIVIGIFIAGIFLAACFLYAVATKR